ncbi:MAG: putative non-specific protein-tyrosine kinase EpsG-like protein [Gammaproteobacteria bacterium]|nr:putative non-specific protein-tyrosine kinase EpsG-like protein [Gammaproteobacteria bacterium]
MSKVEAEVKEIPLPTRDRSRAFGGILVEQGRLTPSDAEEIQRYAGAHGLRFGDAALQLKLLTTEDIEFALAHQYNYPILQRGGENGVADDVVAAYYPQSELIEPLRAIRSQLTHRWFDQSNRKVVAITSPSRGDGRSWLAANLATLFAQIGERTLLIDADMRHPRQHQLFNLSNTAGLSALLTGRAGKEAAVRIHPQLRLFVLPAGITPPNPQELLGRPVFDVVLERFNEQFDVILIDTPAATQTADAQMVAKRAGAALMLARRNHTRHSQMITAMQSLNQTGVNVIGSVMNEY